MKYEIRTDVEMPVVGDYQNGATPILRELIKCDIGSSVTFDDISRHAVSQLASRIGKGWYRSISNNNGGCTIWKITEPKE